MVQFSRLTRQLFVAAGFAAALSVAQASATESVVVADEQVTSDAAIAGPAAAAVTEPALAAEAVAPSVASRLLSTPATSQAMAYAAKRSRVAASRAPYRPVASGGYYDVRGADAWYGRHFVLMLGVGF